LLSCPPADRLLALLDQTQPVPGAQIIALEQHVDYWNDLGWIDPFSSAQFSERQQDYARSFHLVSAYTPQMVVDGQAEFVGSYERDALRAIAKEARAPKATVDLEWRADSKAVPGTVPLHIGVRSYNGLNSEGVADVLLAVTENDLSSNVTRGENAGEQLYHRAVVRQLEVLGQLGSDGSFSAEFNLKLHTGWKPEKLRAAVFLQARRSRLVLGAAVLPLTAPASGS